MHKLLNRLRVLRAEKNISQEDLAKSVGVSRHTILAIERGNYSPSVALALEIANYFKKPMEEVFSLNK